MENLERCCFFIAGKKISLLTNDISKLEENKNKIQQAYDYILVKYDNKLDRESIFLLMIFEYLSESSLEYKEKKYTVEFIEELSSAINKFAFL